MNFFKKITISFIFVLVSLTVLPNVTFAERCPDGVDRPNCAIGNDPAKNNNGNIVPVTIQNPLGVKGPGNIPDFINKILDFAILIAIPILTLAIVYCGFLFVKAQGNAEELSKAKTALLYTLIGAAILLGAKVIADTIGSTVKELGATALLLINSFMV